MSPRRLSCNFSADLGNTKIIHIVHKRPLKCGTTIEIPFLYISVVLRLGRYASPEVDAAGCPPVPARVGDECGTIPPDDTKRSVVIVSAGVALLLNKLLKLQI